MEPVLSAECKTRVCLFSQQTERERHSFPTLRTADGSRRKDFVPRAKVRLEDAEDCSPNNPDKRKEDGEVVVDLETPLDICDHVTNAASSR